MMARLVFLAGLFVGRGISDESFCRDDGSALMRHLALDSLGLAVCDVLAPFCVDVAHRGAVRQACPQTCGECPSSACAWLKTSGSQHSMECTDGSVCFLFGALRGGTDCCRQHGGRARCPEHHLMCRDVEARCGDDHCCELDCIGHGGPRPCSLGSECFDDHSKAASYIADADLPLQPCQALAGRLCKDSALQPLAGAFCPQTCGDCIRRLAEADDVNATNTSNSSGTNSSGTTRTTTSSSTTTTSTTTLTITTTSLRYGQCGESTNLALGIVPSGSSDSKEGRFSGATDGRVDPEHWWFAQADDYPAVLMIDLGAPAVITSMNITGGFAGFKIFKSYRSDDARAWSLVHHEAAYWNCYPGSTTEHRGWAQPTRYVLIQMEDRCGGVHLGRFTVAEWRIFGYYPMRMVQQHRQTWPFCLNLGPCFSYVDLRDAIARCLAQEACDGFSFSAASIDSGRGGGCFKTACSWDDPDREYGRGSHGYWVKRHGCDEPSRPSFIDSVSGLEVCGP